MSPRFMKLSARVGPHTARGYTSIRRMRPNARLLRFRPIYAALGMLCAAAACACEPTVIIGTRVCHYYRTKEQIVSSALGILTCSRSWRSPTAVSWTRRGLGEVVSLDRDDEGERALRNRVATLERRIAMLRRSCGSCSPCCASRGSSSNSREWRMLSASDACWARSSVPGDACRCRRRSEFSE
jgi:hypothetical protein